MRAGLRRATGGQTVAEMPRAAEGHIAEGDVPPDTTVFPVEHRADAQVVPVGAKAGLDLGQAPVLTDQVAGILRITPPGDNAAQAIPGAGFGDPVLVDGQHVRRENPGSGRHPRC